MSKKKPQPPETELVSLQDIFAPSVHPLERDLYETWKKAVASEEGTWWPDGTFHVSQQLPTQTLVSAEEYDPLKKEIEAQRMQIALLVEAVSRSVGYLEAEEEVHVLLPLDAKLLKTLRGGLEKAGLEVKE